MPATDGHVHTEWSWDTLHGSMERSCARAVRLGLPSIAFTEHADATGWLVDPDDLGRMPTHFRWVRDPDGLLRPQPLDVDGYLDCVDRCRHRFPGLRILTGVELSEPHWHPGFITELLGRTDFQRILGSVHTLRDRDGNRVVDLEYRIRPAGDVVRAYLAEVLRLVESGSPFTVLAHVDYAVRDWPASAHQRTTSASNGTRVLTSRARPLHARARSTSRYSSSNNPGRYAPAAAGQSRTA